MPEQAMPDDPTKRSASPGDDHLAKLSRLTRGMALVLFVTALVLAGVALYALNEEGWKDSITLMFGWAAGFVGVGLLVLLVDRLLQRYF